MSTTDYKDVNDALFGRASEESKQKMLDALRDILNGKPAAQTFLELGEKLSVKDKLADYAHDAWSEWMKYIFSECKLIGNGSYVIPKKLVERWKRQMNTGFYALSAKEQKSDYAQAARIMDIFRNAEEVEE